VSCTRLSKKCSSSSSSGSERMTSPPAIHGSLLKSTPYTVAIGAVYRVSSFILHNSTILTAPKLNLSLGRRIHPQAVLFTLQSLQILVPSLNDCCMSHFIRLAPSWSLRPDKTIHSQFPDQLTLFLVGFLLLFPKLPKFLSHTPPAVTGGDQESQTILLLSPPI
jgi:hypothetical protein